MLPKDDASILRAAKEAGYVPLADAGSMPSAFPPSQSRQPSPPDFPKKPRLHSLEAQSAQSAATALDTFGVEFSAAVSERQEINRILHDVLARLRGDRPKIVETSRVEDAAGSIGRLTTGLYELQQAQLITLALLNELSALV